MIFSTTQIFMLGLDAATLFLISTGLGGDGKPVMSSSTFTRSVVTVVMVIAIVLSALAMHAMHKTPDQLPGSPSEILKPVGPGEVLS